jgi:hypothetical protein
MGMGMGFYSKAANEPHKAKAKAMPSTDFCPVFKKGK